MHRRPAILAIKYLLVALNPTAYIIWFSISKYLQFQGSNFLPKPMLLPVFVFSSKHQCPALMLHAHLDITMRTSKRELGKHLTHSCRIHTDIPISDIAKKFRERQSTNSSIPESH
ncbi:hypothetical protein V6Z11_D08G047300 [Gossypium hirsutum]